jgi:hypothetical protein
MAASSHSDAPQNWILLDPVIMAEKPAPQRLSGKFNGLEKPATSSRWTQFNRWGIAIGVGIVLLFGALCGVGGWFYGSAPVVAGVSAGAEQCHDQPDGSQLCWIPIYKRLPAAAYETTPGRR